MKCLFFSDRAAILPIHCVQGVAMNAGFQSLVIDLDPSIDIYLDDHKTIALNISSASSSANLLQFSANIGGETYQIFWIHVDVLHLLPHRRLDLRQQLLDFSGNDYAQLSQAYQLAYFCYSQAFCARCSERNQQCVNQHAMQCNGCQHVTYPRISPTVIFAITDGPRILLANHLRHIAKDGQEPVYTTLAGFVEAGESLEQTVHREALEEVGVRLKNLRYWGSQSWPFPHSLMIGFLAEYDGGELCLQEEEIADARWYDLEHLPRIPPAGTIAHKLIHAARAQFAATSEKV